MLVGGEGGRLLVTSPIDSVCPGIPGCWNCIIAALPQPTMIMPRTKRNLNNEGVAADLQQSNSALQEPGFTTPIPRQG
jgi:hypothetical protein